MKHFVLLLFVLPVMYLHSQGKHDAGFDNLKWNMTVDQVKMLFATDTISEMSVKYEKDIFMRDSGKIVEHTYQNVEAKIIRNDYNLEFTCQFIDNSLCSIEIHSGRDNAKTLYRLFENFKYLNDQVFFIKKDKYPEDKDGWRTDGAVMIKLDGKSDCISLFLKNMKETYDKVIRQMNSPTNREIGRIINIKG